MNRFDVQTIGWVITRDVCVEAARPFVAILIIPDSCRITL